MAAGGPARFECSIGALKSGWKGRVRAVVSNFGNSDARDIAVSLENSLGNTIARVSAAN